MCRAWHDKPRGLTIRTTLTIAGDWEGHAIAASEHAHVELCLARDAGAGLEVVVDAPYWGDAMPVSPAGRCAGLWEFEVVEVFLLGASERYVEIELGPHGHFLVLTLQGVRQVVSDRIPLEFSATIGGPRWQGRARLAREHVPLPISALNAYAIHGIGDARRHLAAHPVPGDRPDFHRIEHFREPLWLA